MHERGLTQSRAGRHAQARRTLSVALSRANDNATIAHIELSLAWAESELGTVQDGIDLCEHALQLTGVPDPIVGLIWSQKGLLHSLAGNGSAALESFATASPLLDLQEHEAIGNLHLNRGLVYLQRGQGTAASDEFERALEQFERAELSEACDKARHNLGYARLVAGDVARAVSLMEEARTGMDSLGPVYEAVSAQDRSEALIAAGLPHQAADSLREASGVLGRRGLRQSQAEALLVLARLNIGNDEPREARKIARRAARLFSNRGSDAWATRAQAVALSAEVAAGVRRPALLEEATDIAGRLREQGLVHDASAVLLQSARMAVRTGDLAEARRRVRGVRQRADAPLENRLLQHEVRAELSLAGRRRADAMQHVRDGLAELHDWQSSFGSLDLQSSVVGHGRTLAQAGLRLAVEDGHPGVVLEWTERARALTTRVAPVRPPDNPEGVEQLQELREIHAAIRAADTAGDSVTGLVRKSSRLQQQIRERAWHDPGSGLVTEPATLDTLMAQLAIHDGVMLVHLVTHSGQLRLLVATGDEARLVDLGRFEPVKRILQGLQADLDMSAAHLPAQLREVVHASLADRLATLSDHLIAPAADLIADRPVLVVPTGGLAGTPWTLLPDLAGHPLTMPRSASLWLTHQEAGEKPPGTAAFVAGPRVARADEEVRRSAAAWGRGASVLAGSAATAEKVSAGAAQADVLHVAAHGRHSADNPLFSGLELADGPWFGYDIDRLASVPRTVVLSSCELGRSTVRWGEEAIGMTVAWLHAGAETVIAAPASVDDDVACEVLAGTHARLAAGRLPSYALAEATAELDLDVPSSFMCFGAGW
ncbi:hypothetical protein VV02_01405 [Luteipulveratus mongoliensis]|uniref:CHAT domain-containing protein n=1 Tax=Luteipulveratus mongoliensis TaxID=571913 RepID=A0A0K1JP92_9MICO|nr:hypothetical protein VV02_01405 [Luteipulveratus mongoliensis]